MRNETENMLQRLTCLLRAHWNPPGGTDLRDVTHRADAESLRRISMTLHRWHEMECGDSNDYRSFSLVRGKRGAKATDFEYDDVGKPYLETHAHHGDGRAVYTGPMPDRERGALKRLRTIMSRYPALMFYVQGDPRGASLYILKPGDVPEGRTADSCYSNGVAVYK